MNPDQGGAVLSHGNIDQAGGASPLMEAAEKGPLWDYNRQLDPVAVAQLPERRYPVVGCLEHFH